MPAADVHDAPELDRVETWRLEELTRAGYPPDAAAKLAPRLDIDLHDAVALLQRGCAAEVALQILL